MNSADVTGELGESPRTCPACRGHDVAPTSQRTNFGEVEQIGEGVAIGSDPQSLTRHFRCRGCGRTWATTGPT